MGLKVRDAQGVVSKLEGMGYTVTDANGYLSVCQGDTVMNVGQLLQSFFEKNPADFYGHAGEIRYKSDIPQDAKSKFIAEHGFAAWNALPANEKSPGAVNVVKPTIVSTELTQAQWLTLTPAEKSAAIAGWGKGAVGICQKIMARR